VKSFGKTFLLCVCAVFVAAWLLAPQFTRSCHRQTPLTACKSNLKNIGTALEMYSTDWSGHYPPNLNLLTPNYLKTLPECLNAERVTYRIATGLNAPLNHGRFQDYYLVECTGTSHQDVNIPADYPKYTGIMGLIEQ